MGFVREPSAALCSGAVKRILVICYRRQVFVGALLISRIVWANFWVGRPLHPIVNKRMTLRIQDVSAWKLSLSPLYQIVYIVPFNCSFLEVQFGELADCCFYYYVSFVLQFCFILDLIPPVISKG